MPELIRLALLWALLSAAEVSLAATAEPVAATAAPAQTLPSAVEPPRKIADTPHKVTGASEPVAPAGEPETKRSISEERLRDLIATLRDEVERERFLSRLEALLQAQEAAPPAPAEPVGPLQAVLDFLEARMAAVETAIGDVVRWFGQLDFFVLWLRFELTDPSRRAVWVAITQQLGSAILVGVGLALVFRLLTRPYLRQAEARARAGQSPLWAASLALSIDAAAVMVFVIALYVTLRLAGAGALILEAATPIMVGALIGRLFAAAAKALLAPRWRAWRLLPLDDDEARWLLRSLTVLNVLLVYATALLAFAAVLGLPWTIRGFFERIFYGIAAVVLMMIVLRYREAIAHQLALRAGTAGGLVGRFLPWDKLAQRWHLLAISLILAHYFAFALQIPGGLHFLFRATATTLVVVVLARLAGIAVDTLFARLAPREADEEEASPDAWQRRRRYLRWTQALTRAAIWLAALLVIGEAWGVGLLAWLGEEEGRTLLSRLLRLAVAFLLALGSIELANAIAERYMAATTADGRPLYSSRQRTLASIARNGVILVASLILLLLFLSEIGVQTGPLLAGAGIVGLAIGFGAQKLVQDLITGLFILLGDTIRVGDVVDLGGKSGVVEAMSMRTVTLRSYDGHLHTIPYSAINIVTNMSKDFSYWVADVAVAYREDVDQVMRVLEEIDASLRREWPFRRLILAPIEIAGVDRFADSAVIIRARIKTRPGEQWRVGREFNRRLKKRFDELGIEIPFPHRTLYFGADKHGAAPPAFVRILEPRAPAESRSAGELLHPGDVERRG